MGARRRGSLGSPDTNRPCRWSLAGLVLLVWQGRVGKHHSSRSNRVLWGVRGVGNSDVGEQGDSIHHRWTAIGFRFLGTGEAREALRPRLSPFSVGGARIAQVRGMKLLAPKIHTFVQPTKLGDCEPLP